MHAYVYTHIYIYIYMYICIFIYMHTHIYEHTYIHTHLHTLPHPHIPPSHSLTFLFSFPLSAPSPLCALPFLFSFSSLRIDTFISLFCKEDILCSKMRLLCGECRLFLPSFLASFRPSVLLSFPHCSTAQMDMCVCPAIRHLEFCIPHVSRSLFPSFFLLFLSFR